jgi:hypothetical protein
MFFSGVAKLLKQILSVLKDQLTEQKKTNTLLGQLVTLLTPPPPGPAVLLEIRLGTPVKQ